MDRDLSIVEERAVELRDILTNTEQNALATAAELFWREQSLLYSPR